MTGNPLKGVRVTEQLAEQIQRANPMLQAEIIGGLEHYVRELRRSEREQHPSVGGRAVGAYHAMTVWLEPANIRPPAGLTVQCRSGCASCCRLMITVFPDEAALAVLAARDAGIELDREKLQRQALAATVDEWRGLSREDRTCVFLRDEQCSIYEYRPAACRKYMVVTPPEFCDTDRHPGYEVGMLAVAMAEAIMSAAITVWGESKFAPALLAAMNEGTNG